MTYDYENLVGIEYEAGKTDCYGTFREFYKQIFGIDLPNYARPEDFWNHKQDLFSPRYHKNGFRTLDVHPSEYQFGDVFLMSIRSDFPNHVAVLVEKGMIFHHFTNRLSEVEPYKGIWRNCTTHVLRHKDVVIETETQMVDILDVLPPEVKRRIDAQLEDN